MPVTAVDSFPVAFLSKWQTTCASCQHHRYLTLCTKHQSNSLSFFQVDHSGESPHCWNLTKSTSTSSKVKTRSLCPTLGSSKALSNKARFLLKPEAAKATMRRWKSLERFWKKTREVSFGSTQNILRFIYIMGRTYKWSICIFLQMSSFNSPIYHIRDEIALLKFNRSCCPFPRVGRYRLPITKGDLMMLHKVLFHKPSDCNVVFFFCFFRSRKDSGGLSGRIQTSKHNIHRISTSMPSMPHQSCC